MARIRSIHPGLFSDPEFADLSSDAGLFYLGLLTEADDNGVFEWKPTTLRIRLRPTKDGPVETLLSELVAADKVRRYEIDGRQYGAIRKFTQWQRPKSPKSWHPIPEHFRTYVGSSGEISPIGGNETPSSPLSSEKPPQRKEEGGRRDEEEGLEEPSPASTAPRKRGADDRGHRLPDDWAPDDDLKALAAGLGLDVGRVLAEFRDYWRAVPGAKGRKLDWPATFRNRCRELAERKGGRPPPGGAKSPTVAQALDDYRNDPNWKAAL